MRLAILLGLILIPFLVLAETGINFEAEDIDFALRASVTSPDSLVWEVSGVYHFSNHGEQALSRIISFPIPSGEGVSPHRDLLVELLDSPEGAACRVISESSSGFSFGLHMAPLSFIGIRIHYRQMVGATQVSYILRTANSWGRPLPLAIYTLYVEKGIRLDSVSLPGPLILGSKTGDYYFWEYRNFRPKEDFELILE